MSEERERERVPVQYEYGQGKRERERQRGRKRVKKLKSKEYRVYFAGCVCGDFCGLYFCNFCDSQNVCDICAEIRIVSFITFFHRILFVREPRLIQRFMYY